jgi:broad specificity phosphatase PhoE
MNIILIRHGETEDNRKGVIYGQADRSLSDIGKKQAQQAALLLKDEKIDFIYSSDLGRCIETAEVIARYHSHITLATTPLLREISGGRASKLPLRLSPRLLSQAVRVALLLNFTVPSGESWSNVKSRIRNFLNELYTVHPDATVLLVTHNVAIQATHSLLKQPGEKEIRGKTVPNCSISNFVMHDSLLDSN